MNISGAGVAGATQIPNAASAANHQRMGAAVDAAAKLFGMSTSDLQAQLKGGKSLLDIAQSKGVSSATLVGTIQQSLTQGANAPTADVAAAMAQRMAGHHRHAHAASSAAASATTAPSSDPDGDGDNDAGRARFSAKL